MNYLHSHGLAHTELRLENVHISPVDRHIKVSTRFSSMLSEYNKIFIGDFVLNIYELPLHPHKFIKNNAISGFLLNRSFFGSAMVDNRKGYRYKNQFIIKQSQAHEMHDWGHSNDVINKNLSFLMVRSSCVAAIYN